MPWACTARSRHRSQRAFARTSSPGQLESGTRLRQVELAQRFGVSTTPVREALAALQSEGLVRLHPQRGAVVFVPTVEGLREHYEIRAALEALAAERAAERFDPARGEQLAAMLDEMAAGPGVERYLELNLRFHSELYELAGRPRLVDMIETLRDASSAYLHIYAKVDFPSERLDAEHREILAACQRGRAGARGRRGPPPPAPDGRARGAEARVRCALTPSPARPPAPAPR